MKKYVLLVAFLSLSETSHAENQFSIGLGEPYGGFLGGKYAIGLENFKVYAGAGLLGYSSDFGSVPGYNLGFDYRIESTKHSLGLSYGTVALSSINRKKAEYIGTALNYNYYFSDFNSRSWMLGLSAFQGKRDTPSSKYKDNETGLTINVGFQF